MREFRDGADISAKRLQPPVFGIEKGQRNATVVLKDHGAMIEQENTRPTETAAVEEIGRALNETVGRKLPNELYKSLTWDRGKELTDHRRFTLATNIDVYFCDPQSPWQRGTNENTNGLLRQYFPKKTDLSAYSQSDLDKVALRLNQRPRKTLGFETPASKLQASVALTG